jgi:hypothetical protein
MKAFIVIIGVCLAAFGDTTSFRERAIDSIMKWEGGVHTFDSVEYNYGLSGRYHGNVAKLTRAQAKQKFRELWWKSNAGRLPDTGWQLLFFDTYVLFNPDTARMLMVSCYSYDEFLMRRLQQHLDNHKKYKKLQPFLYGYMRRLSSLRDMLAQ